MKPKGSKEPAGHDDATDVKDALAAIEAVIGDVGDDRDVEDALAAIMALEIA